jgi:dimeric dUTPase (all-alpha-NTP-PPase superfamily)
VNLKIIEEKQRYLEQFVRSKTDMTEEEFSSVDMMDKRVFAFKVEFAEFANVTAWFKYWKKSHVFNREEALEELADCFHFLAAIGLYRNYYPYIGQLDWKRWSFLDESELYTSIMENDINSSGQWKTVWEYLLQIGMKLGFTVAEMELWYLIKNQKNIERQNSNY